MENQTETCPWIVGIGASAGGLQALQKFFENTPGDAGLVYVVVQHLSPDHKSLMMELLARYTSMQVLTAEENLALLPDHIYLTPPTHNIVYDTGRLHLIEREERAVNLPIDTFFHSLAHGAGQRSVGVILSGTGSDGTRGVRAIKEAGGLVIVQEEQSAQFDGMPRSAIASGAVDLVLAPEEMAFNLVHYVNHTISWATQSPEGGLPALLRLLEADTQVDFSGYKKETLLRRIERRMSINNLTILDDYVMLVQRDARELRSLYKDLLIGVTRFFRDPECFLGLFRGALTDLMNGANMKAGLRCWIPACSTGEEVYTIAILFCEAAETAGLNLNLKIFATDIDRESLEFASRAIYPESIAADVTPERLDRYFVKRANGYEVCRQIREMVVFANHNILRDPPFTRLDLVSCRNLLIYFDGTLQRKALSMLHFALRSGGYLFLGSSESVGELSDYFRPLDGRNRLFQTLGVLREPYRWKGRPAEVMAVNHNNELGLAVEVGYRNLLEQYCPPAFLVNPQGEVLHVFVDADRYLRLAPGNIRLDISTLLPPRLAALITSGLNRSNPDGQEVVYPEVELTHEGENHHIRVRLQPFQPRSASRPFILVSLEEDRRLPSSKIDRSALSEAQEDQLVRLRQELSLAREHLQSTVEQLETANEELQATNEELQATNEELMSSNEELQSVNEELYTLNSEHQAKIHELTNLNVDVENLLNISDIATLLLDEDLTIRRFSPSVTHFINVLPRDAGRPLEHLTLRFAYSNLTQDATRVLADGTSLEKEFSTLDGKTHFRLLMRPFRSTGPGLSKPGLVMTFVDTTQEHRAYSLQAMLDGLKQNIAVVDAQGIIRMVNRSWCQFSAENQGPADPEQWIGQSYFTAVAKDSPEAEIIDRIKAVLSGAAEGFSHIYPCHSANEQRWFVMKVGPVEDQLGGAVVSHLLLPGPQDVREMLGK